jgi:hypothetical protein
MRPSPIALAVHRLCGFLAMPRASVAGRLPYILGGGTWGAFRICAKRGPYG